MNSENETRGLISTFPIADGLNEIDRNIGEKNIFIGLLPVSPGC